MNCIFRSGHHPVCRPVNRYGFFRLVSGSFHGPFGLRYMAVDMGGVKQQHITQFQFNERSNGDGNADAVQVFLPGENKELLQLFLLADEFAEHLGAVQLPGRTVCFGSVHFFGWVAREVRQHKFVKIITQPAAFKMRVVQFFLFTADGFFYGGQVIAAITV